MSLKVKDVNALYIAYMPFLKGGGLFAPTAQRYNLGDEVVLLVTLIDENERLSVAGRVVWITPIGAQGNRTAGIGVQFNETGDGEAARARIEALLAGTLSSERPTQTM
ncbi:type IV pilus assembly protein PilZ [Luteibacter rhizovicinus]|uniref:Type IV pilus assembly protein PilZ n=2 Tax=Luteibacter rhizovicinus TaxID=242606 RepID=A0A4V2W4V8_9GAMM|nr:type IV pilus assembly protein PilZ [Luteibacter rhizovicinus]